MSGYCLGYGPRRFEVDLCGQLIHAEIEENGGWMDRPSTPLSASVAETGITSSFTPLFAMAVKAKAFDDRLYAKIEQLAHEGVGKHQGLFELLAKTREQLAPGSNMRSLLDAAAHLTGAELPQSGPAKFRAKKWLSRFLKDGKASKPIGFYSTSESLSRLFKHDRILQQKITQEDAGVIRKLFEKQPELRAAYQSHLRLVSRLTGELATASVLDAAAEQCAILPASDSPEGRLLKQLFGNNSIPDGFHLGTELVSRIRDDRLRTEPTVDSGWYAHQFHAIAALLTPETEGLEVGPIYKRELEETFQALFASTRETHAKQLEVPAVASGAGALVIAPRITVEPVPEYYGRVASAYAFLREQLTGILGDAVMNSSLANEGALGLGDAITEIELLFHGAEAVSRDELGCPEPSKKSRAAVAIFKRWQRQCVDDPDLLTDMRVATPVFYDMTRKTVRVCATLGVETRSLQLDFVKRPTVTIHSTSHDPLCSVQPAFEGSHQLVLSPITIECDVRVPPSREELRTLCDKHQDASAIKHALESRPG